jgi:hypothetical protein
VGGVVKADVKRQGVLEVALDWVSSSKDQSIAGYMADHRRDTDISELKNYFMTVIDWIDSIFIASPDTAMRGLDWGRLYETYHGNAYKPSQIDADLQELLADPAVKNRGVYEYLLGGKTDTRLLNVRVFDESTKRLAYDRQTEQAKGKTTSNCPLCAAGDNVNKTRIYTFKEMEADHVAAWSKGGASTLDNCEMLCVTHNRAKGNR